MSLRLRLTLWYTGILAATLLLVSVLVYGTLTFALRQQVDQFLNARAQQYTRALILTGVQNRGQTIRDQMAASNPDIYAQLVAPDGTPLSRTSNLPAGWPTDQVDDALSSGQPTSQTIRLGDQVVWVQNFPLSFEGRQFGVLQLGRDFTQAEASLTFLRQALLITTIAGLLASFAAGWLLARQALRPISRIAETAREIGDSRDFTRRVTYAGPADELGRLTATFNEMLGHIQAAYQQIETALSAQRRFVADASHELRTPLTTIRGNIGLLSYQNGSTEDRREALEDMSSEAERMSRLVSNLLVLARADAGLHVAKHHLSLAEVVQDVYRQARVLSNGVTLLVSENQPAEVQANADYLKQLLFILVDNALRNTPSGGQVEIRQMTTGGWAKVTVKDTGKGISEDALPHIFDRFYQADRSRSGGGTGLGLSIAKWIAEEHHGHIDVASTAGRGSTFTVWLPRHQAASEADTRTPAGAVG